MNIITGIPRSGTTLTAKVFQACGADFSEVTSLMESPKARKITMEYLSSIGCDPLGQDPLPENYFKFRQFQKDLSGLEIIKQCKVLLMWEHWVENFPNAKWIIVRRSPEKIIDSCLRTSFMRSFNTREGWSSWIDYHLKEIDNLKTEVDYVEVWPEVFKINPEYQGMREAVEFLGYDWDEAAARAQICQSKLQ